MTAPQSVTAPPAEGMPAQILLKLGEMGEKLAVINTKLDALPDHEARIRALERFRFTLAGLSIVGGIVAGAIGYWVGHVLH